jgi:hypothetical protein
MLTQSKSGNCVWLLLLCLLLVLMVSCESRDMVVGTYRGTVKDSSHQAEILLELKANGEGVWRMGDEEVPFSWYLKGDQLRVNTKSGGVIAASFDTDSLLITLPNHGPMSFRKIH